MNRVVKKKITSKEIHKFLNEKTKEQIRAQRVREKLGSLFNDFYGYYDSVPRLYMNSKTWFLLRKYMPNEVDRSRLRSDLIKGLYGKFGDLKYGEILNLVMVMLL